MEEKTKLETIKKPKVHPRKRANIVSKLFFCWTFPLFVKGVRKDLTEEDLHGPLHSHESENLGDKLEAAWFKEQKRKKPSLWRALTKVFIFEFTLYGTILLFQELVLKMANPILIGRLMSYYNPEQTNITKTEAYLYASGIILVSLINVLMVHTYFMGLQHIGMKVRVACSSLIYRKALRLSRSSMVETTIGQMVNLMANDVNRFDFLLMHLHYLFIAPIEAAVVIYLLYNNIHPAALAGVALLMAFVPLQLFLGKKTSYFRFRTAQRTDKRVRLMNEIINGIQVIKMYTWEKPFAKLVEMARRTEIHQIRGSSYLKAVTVSFIIFLNRISIYLCCITYALTGNILTAEYVYVVSNYYSILRQSLTMFLPRGITLLAETNVSVKRLEKFFNYEEIDQRDQTPTMPTIGITIDSVSVKWSPILDYTLTNVSFTVKSNQLVAVVGPVGSGKSTLLQLILKEIPPEAGQVDIRGRLSYAAQEPWLFSSTIRQNILFGSEMEVKKYQQVVKACALERDFSSFPFGDRTLVGERGVMLSGGQKARINLARAIYKDADIYLLDDPLSAVDAHVGKQLFDNCINGYLKDKCTVLVTHQLQYLKNVDKIYLLEKGTITAEGTYNELRNSGGKFVKLLEEITTNEKEEEKKRNSKLQRFISVKSLHDDDKPKEVKEQRSTGVISKRVYLKYLKAGGNYFYSILLLCLFVLVQVFASFSDLFVTFWVNLEQDRKELTLKNETNQTESDLLKWKDHFFTVNTLIYVYTFLIVTLVILTLTRSLSFFKVCMKASERLHNNMFETIVRASMRFFNTNPSGRILNRFSKDVGAIDETLPQSVTDTIQVGLNVFAITIVLSSINAYIIIPSVIIFGIFYLYKVIFLATSRDLKRIESTAKSPVFSHLSASLQGLSTIRAFKAQTILRQEFDKHQDLHSSAFYMFLGCSRAFGFWLDINCIIYIGVVILSFLFIGTETYGGNVGLAITQSITMTGMLQWGMKQWSELENQMTSVERVVEYTEVEREDNTELKPPPKFWPQDGKIVVEDLSMRYSIDEPQVLKNLTFTINPKEKIGIVGRTGAGKSSLISALFRLAPIEGKILIDDVNTQEISLNNLRSKISIIPQEPVLFSGTLRENLDPFEEYKDEQLWNALNEVNLKEIVADLPAGLVSKVSEGGSNFSVGQRQLLCLARAVLRNNKILVMDEATANVDPQTDELIQTTIRRKFEDCTVLTIAHRLHTIIDSDKILVMSAGEVVEFDHPYTLLQNENGVFYSLVKEIGAGMVENFLKIATESYQTKTQ